MPHHHHRDKHQKAYEEVQKVEVPTEEVRFFFHTHKLKKTPSDMKDLLIPTSTLFSHSVVNLLVVNLFTYLSLFCCSTRPPGPTSSLAAPLPSRPCGSTRKRWRRMASLTATPSPRRSSLVSPVPLSTSSSRPRDLISLTGRGPRGKPWYFYLWSLLLSILRVFSRNLLHVTCYSHAQQEANKMYEEEHENKPNE